MLFCDGWNSIVEKLDAIVLKFCLIEFELATSAVIVDVVDEIVDDNAAALRKMDDLPMMLPIKLKIILW